jgi:subfamily B ATP-binding cassette protein MsbA
MNNKNIQRVNVTQEHDNLMNDEINTNESNNQWARLFAYYLPHRKLIFIAFVGLCLFSVIDAGMIYFIKPLIDQGLTSANSQTLQMGAALVIAIFFLRGVASFISNYTIAYMSSKITFTIRQQAFEKILQLPRSFYDSNSRGSIISKLTYDTEQISQAFSKAGVVIIRESVIIIVLLGMMIYNSWQLTTIFLLVGPVIAFLINKVAKRFKSISTKLQVSMGEVTRSTEQAILNQQEILLLNTAPQVSEQFSTVNNKNRTQTIKLAATSAQSNPVIQFIASFAIAGVLLLASFEQVLNSLTSGTFTLVLVAMGSLLKPLKQLTNVNQHLQKGLAAATSLFNLLDQSPEINSGTKVLTGTSFDLSFKSLNFQYANNKIAIKEFSVDIPSGKTVAIVGESGSGKSTLSALLLRLYQAPKESIFINDVAIENYSLASLRSNCSLVSQNIVLIDDTLANNISFGCYRKVTAADIEYAAQKANVLAFADEMPLGLATKIGENGRNLSGGQRQRIAIARAILRDSPIIILDEATSALDNNAERIVRESFTEIAKGKTLIVIAHRLSSINQVDEIMVMHQGTLVEQGTHEELLIQKGYYHALYKEDT